MSLCSATPFISCSLLATPARTTHCTLLRSSSSSVLGAGCGAGVRLAPVPGAGDTLPHAVAQSQVSHGPPLSMSQKNTVAPAATPAATGVTSRAAPANRRDSNPGDSGGGSGTSVSGGRGTGGAGTGGAGTGASAGAGDLPSGSQYATGF